MSVKYRERFNCLFLATELKIPDGVDNGDEDADDDFVTRDYTRRLLLANPELLMTQDDEDNDN